MHHDRQNHNYKMSCNLHSVSSLKLQTIRSTNLIPLETTDPSSISRYASRFITLLDQPAVSDLNQVIVVTMKSLHRLSTALRQSPYGDAGRMAELARYKQQAMALIQFASGLRLRLGGDVYRQLSSMSEFVCCGVWDWAWVGFGVGAGLDGRSGQDAGVVGCGRISR